MSRFGRASSSAAIAARESQEAQSQNRAPIAEADVRLSGIDPTSFSRDLFRYTRGLGNAGANPAAAPATVTGEICGQRPLRRKPWEGGRKSKTREPGDLPRAVVLFPVGVRRGLAGETAVTAKGAVHGGFRDSHLSK